jgi:hypothetical protein
VDFPVYAGTNTNWHFDSRFPSKILTVGGFMVPLYANTFLLPSSRYGPGGFNSMTNSFLPRSGEFPVPDWRLCISNRLTYIMSSQNLIVDAVTLSFRTNLNLTEISTSPNYNYIEPFAVAALWDTNRVADPANLSIPTVGIIRQLDISLGKTALSDSDWRAFNAEVNDKTSSIQSFRSFVNNFSTSNLSQQAPFTATRRFLHLIKWQANDPLVHYLMEDLNDITNNASIRFLKPRDLDAFTNNLGRLNERYRPWLGNPLLASVGFPDVGIQDAGVFQSDDWNFPTNLLAAPGLLGRVHRGTPWQTIYLKARAISSDHWLNQSSDLRTHPTNDWKIATLFISLLNTNAPTRLFSVNQSNQSAWGAILNGLTVLSNTTPTLYRTAPTNFDFLTIDPGSPQVQIIVDGINHTRAASPFGYFPEIGDVLATPELTVASPWLDLSAEVQLLYSLTDEVYEKIPEQLLPLLRPDPILRVRRIDDALHFQALVFAGYLYVLETSTDLGHWTQLDTQFADGETVDFPDPIGLTDNQQFFRVRLMTQ